MNKRDIISTVMDYGGVLKIAAAAGKKANKNRLTVLAYHRVVPYDKFCSFDYDDGLVSATPGNFSSQVKWLKDNFNIISFSDLKKGCIPSNALIITFDDGYRDNYNFVYPILKKHEVPATIFLSTGYVGAKELFWWDAIAYVIKKASIPRLTIALDKEYEYDIVGMDDKRAAIASLLKLAKRISNEERLSLLDKLKMVLEVKIPETIGQDLILSWAEVMEMSKNGIEFGSHSVSHPVLANVSDSVMRHEIETSKNDIERNIGKEVIVFSYPVGGGGSFDARAEEILRNAGYSYAVTYVHGINNMSALDRFCLKRIHVEKDDTLPLFKSKIVFPKLIRY